MTFTGFSDSALAFYDGLEADNSKSYWTDHQDTFEREVKGPMLALLDALAPQFGPAKLFRPYRDVRFSADKSPYKTQLGATLSPAGDGSGGGVLYVQLSGGGLFVGGGHYQMARDQLERYRRAVDDDASGERLQSLTDALCATGMSLSGATLQRAPRGIAADHRRIDLLRRKGLAAGQDFGAPDWLATARCLTEVVGVFRALAPLNAWLGQYVGPSTEPRDERGRR